VSVQHLCLFRFFLQAVTPFRIVFVFVSVISGELESVTTRASSVMVDASGTGSGDDDDAVSDTDTDTSFVVSLPSQFEF